MLKKVRTVLFFTCLLLFFLITPLVVLYSQGYRIDFEKRKIVKTGAFYFKVSQKGAEVFVDGKLKKKTDFLFGYAFLENLLPKGYFVEIKKSGYQAWKKNLEIKETQVTEAKNITLAKENLRFELLDKDIKDFFISPDERKIILKKESSDNNENAWSLKLYDLERGIKSHLINEKEISKTGATLLELRWAQNAGRVLLKIEAKPAPKPTEVKPETKFFLLDLRESPLMPKPLDYLKQVEDVIFHPTNPEKIFFTKAQEDSLVLFETDIENGRENFVLKNVMNYKLVGENIFWISKEGFLEKSDLSGRSQKISLEPIPFTETKPQIEVFNSQIFIRNDENIFLFNEDSKKFQEIGNKTKSLRLSPDYKKICLWNDHEIWVLFLKEELGQPQKRAGEKIFLTRFSKKIGEVFWFTSHYLIFNVDSEMKIIEIDDRGEIQIWTFADFKNPEVYFVQKDKVLFVFSMGNLFISERLF